MRQRVNIRPRGVTVDTILVVTASEHVYGTTTTRMRC